MDGELIKFITDLGSIGAICYVVYLFVRYMTEEQARRLEEHKQFLDTIEMVTKAQEEGEE